VPAAGALLALAAYKLQKTLRLLCDTTLLQGSQASAPTEPPGLRIEVGAREHTIITESYYEGS